MSNTDPVVENYKKTTQENMPVSGRVEATDADGDTLDYTLSNYPENGMAVVASNGEWTYIPKQNYVGPDMFQVMVDDGNGGIAISTIEIEIRMVNDAPITKNEIVQTPRNIPVGGVIQAESLNGNTLTFFLKKDVRNGKLTLDSTNGNWIYVPNLNFIGVDMFEVLVEDNFGATAISRIVIAVTPSRTVFKQLSVMENVRIPDVKPEAEDIVKVIADVEIIEKTVIQTPIGTSFEGQILTGWKLIVEGLMKQKIEYIADEPTQSMHCAHFDVPFSTYLVLPRNFRACTPVEIKACIEDIYFEQLDKRNIFKNITLALHGCFVE